MKKLQNNYTTPEQSKRLLELGLPVSSADCFSRPNGEEIGIYQPVAPCNPDCKIDKFIAYANKRYGRTYYIPVWSVGRLIEIYEYCTDEKFQRESSVCNLMADCIRSIQLAIRENRFDFSKLED